MNEQDFKFLRDLIDFFFSNLERVIHTTINFYFDRKRELLQLEYAFKEHLIKIQTKYKIEAKMVEVEE